jgi:hypothetical protein
MNVNHIEQIDFKLVPTPLRRLSITTVNMKLATNAARKNVHIFEEPACRQAGVPARTAVKSGGAWGTSARSETLSATNESMLTYQ